MKRRNLKVHFSSATAEWATPQWLFDALNKEFGFTLDPCATAENAKCSKYFTVAADGLKQSWDYQVVFMNPPYGRVIGAWMQKAWESSQRGATVVCLVPARTDTEWWHRFAMRGEVRLLKGRLKFGNAKSCAPFPSAVVVFRPQGKAEKLKTETLKSDQGIEKTEGTENRESTRIHANEKRTRINHRDATSAEIVDFRFEISKAWRPEKKTTTKNQE